MILPYRGPDIEVIELTPEHRRYANTARETLRELAAKNLAVTAWVDKGPLAVVGARPMGDNLCEVFIFPSSTLVRPHRKTLFEDVAKTLEWAREKFPIVHSVTKPRVPEAENFLVHLGFKIVDVRAFGGLDYNVWELQ